MHKSDVADCHEVVRHFDSPIITSDAPWSRVPKSCPSTDIVACPDVEYARDRSEIADILGAAYDREPR